VGELISAHLRDGGLAVIATHLDISVAGSVRSLVLGGDGQ
jgi:ABC-type transport system involved in cytochrome c biogenesis ATPase subunit